MSSTSYYADTQAISLPAGHSAYFIHPNEPIMSAEDAADTIYEHLHPYSREGDKIQRDLTLAAQGYQSMGECFSVAHEHVMAHGAAIVEDAPLADLKSLREWCCLIGTPMDYQGGTNVRQNQGEGVLSVGTEPPWANVAAHNEMCYANIYPELFVIGCKAAPKQAGPTVIGDNAVMTHLLMKLPLGDKLRRKGLRYIRNFDNAYARPEDGTAFASWQEVFDTDDKAIVVNRASARLGGKRGCTVEWQDNGALRLSYLAPAFEYDAKLQRNLCFTSIGNHGYWFRQWVPFNALQNIDRPFHLQFGDGTEFSEAELEQMVMIANDSSFPLYWKPGTIALLDNRRFTHARPQFELPAGETRELGVVMLNPVERRGQVGDHF